MIQIISKNGVVKCTTSIPYPDAIIAQMKKAGYRVRTKEDKKK